MELWFKAKNGMLLTSREVAAAALIVDGKNISPTNEKEIREYAEICMGIVEEVKHPSLAYLILNGQKTKAIQLYYNANKDKGVNLVLAREVIETLEKRLKSNQ